MKNRNSEQKYYLDRFFDDDKWTVDLDIVVYRWKQENSKGKVNI